jgi:hypothetical protein
MIQSALCPPNLLIACWAACFLRLGLRCDGKANPVWSPQNQLMRSLPRMAPVRPSARPDVLFHSEERVDNLGAAGRTTTRPAEY